ncbi:winged helix-turn-helix domain-containing protein, partial [Pseudomonas aeruginosa]|nr:winged helix-turn-helix domain-containing protein [Pseudomonas aeruginosa]
VLEQLRQWSQVPVIMLTVRAGEAEKVRALDTGANDYVTKPFGTQELMARVRALLRTRSVPSDGTPPVFDDGHLHVDLVRREVALDGEPVALTRKEYALLSLLLRNAARVVTQPHILHNIWCPTHQHHTHYLHILFSKLRHKLLYSALSSRYLFTE